MTLESPSNYRDPLSRWAPWLIVAILAITFGRSVSDGISPFDDNANIFLNPFFNRPDHSPELLGSHGVTWFWKHTAFSLYIPLTYTLWFLLAKMTWVSTPDSFGTRLDPHIFHAASLLLHIINTLLVYQLLRKLTQLRRVHASWPALAGALIYGVHPLQIETIAWTSGMKDLLYCAFSLLSLLAYLRAIQPHEAEQAPDPAWKRPASYLAALLLMVAGMLCKPTAMVTPLLAFVIDLTLVRRSWKRAILSTIPYFLAAIPLMIVARTAQPSVGAPAGPWFERPIVSGASLMFYLGKLLAPIHPAFDYGWRPAEMLQKPWFWYLACLAPMIAVAFLLSRRRTPWLWAGALITTASLLPTLGLVPFDFQFESTVADHYMVLAMLGPAIAITGLLLRNGGKPNLPTILPIALITVALASVSFSQVRYWRTPEDITRQTLAVTPDSALAHYCLASIYQSRGDFENAKLEYLATETNPYYFKGPENLSLLCARTGDPIRAVAAYRQMQLIASRFPPAARPRSPVTPYTLALQAIHYHHLTDTPFYICEMIRNWVGKPLDSWFGFSQ